MRPWMIVTMLSGAALLGGCTENVSIGAGPEGPEWAVGVGYSVPPTNEFVFRYSGEIPIRDPSGREQTVLVGLRMVDSTPAGPWNESDYQYFETVRVCYRQYFGLARAGMRESRVFWEAGLTFGTEYEAQYDPFAPPGERYSWDTNGGAALLGGVGARCFFPDRPFSQRKTAFLMEVSVDALLGDVETPVTLGCLLGWSFGAGGAERRAERRAGMLPGAFAMRAGMLLPASGEGVEFGESMTLGLSYRLAEDPDAKVSWELAADFGWPEEAGLYESRPVVCGLNLLVPLGTMTGKVRAHAVAGIGAMYEFAREPATGEESVNSAAVLRLGGGAVFADGHVGARLTYLLFPGSRNLIGRACFTVVCDF